MEQDPGQGADSALRRLAESMQAHRSRRSLSLHALSDLAAVDRKLLRGLEKAAMNPTLRTLDRVAQAFGISVAALLGTGATSEARGLFDAPTLVALNVKRLRRERDWTAADVETRIKMKAAYVSFIETGRRGCTLQTLIRLADAFGIDVAELLKSPAVLEPDRSGHSTSKTAERGRQNEKAPPEG